MMQLGVAIALLLAIGLPVVRADDGEECMGDVVYCFMVVIYAMAMGTFSSFMRSPPRPKARLHESLAHKASPAFLHPRRHPDRGLDGTKDHPVSRAAASKDRSGHARRHHAAVIALPL